MSQQLTWWNACDRCSQDNCLGVAKKDDTTVFIRESDRPNEVITTTPVNFAAFVRAAKDGEYDIFLEGIGDMDVIVKQIPA